MDQYGGFLKRGYPQSSSILDWDFPSQKPSIIWGTPMTMETSIWINPQMVGLFHGKSQSKMDDDWGYPMTMENLQMDQ